MCSHQVNGEGYVFNFWRIRYQNRPDAVELRKKALELSRLMRHRGPDWSGIYASDNAILAHERLSIVDVNERLSIVDVNAGAQLLTLTRGRNLSTTNKKLMCNPLQPTKNSCAGSKR